MVSYYISNFIIGPNHFVYECVCVCIVPFLQSFRKGMFCLFNFINFTRMIRSIYSEDESNQFSFHYKYTYFNNHLKPMSFSLMIYGKDFSQIGGIIRFNCSIRAKIETITTTTNKATPLAISKKNH